MGSIHPTAIVHPNAKIGKGTSVGAYSIIGEEVVLGENCQVQEHVVLRGLTEIGDESIVYPFSVVGADPQHLQYKGEPTVVRIGKRVTLRESVTVHRATSFGGGLTSIGDESLIMAYCHVAHDCHVGKGVIMANGVQMAGHTEVHDYAVVGGMTAIVQHVRVGRYAYIGGSSILRKDMPPFMVGKGNDFELQGVNSIGLERKGFSPEKISRLKKLYKIFCIQHHTVSQAIEKITQELGNTDEIAVFLDFIKQSKVGFAR